MRTAFSPTLFALILGLLSPVVSMSDAAAAPSQLYGKSVIVSWTEEREQRVNDEAQVRNVGRNGQFSVYLSSAGKPFSRMNYSFSGARGGLKSGSKDAVGGEGSGNRKVVFSGNAMNAGMGLSGGARNIFVTFDNGFASCSARVLTGRESGSSSIKGKSLVNGNSLEILSVKTGAANCSVQNGNVFGN